MQLYCVYILGSRSHRLYTGITRDLVQRVEQHRRKIVQGYTAKYATTALLNFECSANPRAAIAREKQIKGWSRRKKLALIQQRNPLLRDLMVNGEIRDSSSLRSSE